MHIETADDQVLDLLSSPLAPVVRLQRKVAYNTESTTIQNCKPESNSEPLFEATAVWWSSSEVGEIDGDGHRRLYGEIQLSKHLQPSSAIFHYSLSVSWFLCLLNLCSSYPISIMWLFFHLKQSLSTQPTRVPCQHERSRSLQFTLTVPIPRVTYPLLPATLRHRQVQGCHISRLVRKATGRRLILFEFHCNIASIVLTFPDTIHVYRPICLVNLIKSDFEIVDWR